MKGIHITAYIEDVSKIEPIKSVFKAMKIKFEISKDKPYKKEFVEKILKGDSDLKQVKAKKFRLTTLISYGKNLSA